MATLLKRILRAKAPEPDLPKEVRTLLAKLQKEKSAMTQLLGRMERAGANLQGLSSGLAAAETRADSVADRLERLEQRAGAVESLERRLSGIESNAAQLHGVGDDLRDKLDTFDGRLEDIQSVVCQLENSKRDAEQLRRDLAGLTETATVLEELTGRADGLQGSFQGMSLGLDKLREEQASVKRGHDDALQRTQEVSTLSNRLKEDVGQSASRIAQLESTLGEVGRVQQLADRTQQDLKRLNALSEHIIQKSKALEQQREVIDRAATQTERLDSLVWELDAGLKKAQQESKQIKKLQAGMADVQGLSQRVTEQEQAIRSLHRQNRDEEKELAARYERLRREVHQGLERFSLEQRAVASVTQEMMDLRAALGEFESRFQALQSAGKAIARAQSRADELEGRLTTLTAEISRVDEQAEKVRSVEIGLERLEATATNLASGVASLQAREPSLREFGEQLAEVRTHLAEVRDAQQWLPGLNEEIELVRANHQASLSTIEGVNSALAKVDEKMAVVQSIAGQVELVRVDAKRALTSADELEQRAPFLSRLHERVDRLGSISTELDDRLADLKARSMVVAELQTRSESLQQRLDDADARFAAVSQRAAEVDRVETRLVSATAGIDEAEARLGGLRQGVDLLERRDAEVRAVAERAERLAQELSRREVDLQAARTSLVEVDALRLAAMQIAEDLAERAQTNAEQLAGADIRAGKITGIVQQLEERASGLRFTENRLSRFEEKLARLESAEAEIVESIEALNERQRSVDAVRADLGSIFQVAERTLADLQAITESRQEIQETGEKLGENLARAQQVDVLMTSIDQRREKLEAAEEEVFRLEVLLADVQTSMETIRGQKPVIDLGVEKANQLAFQLKEAEVLLNALREERELTTRLHTGASDERKERPRRAG